MNEPKDSVNDSGEGSRLETGLENVDSLITELSSKDMRVRARARQSLVNIGEPAVVPLVKALANQKDWVRLEAAKALGQMNVQWGSHATPEITGLLINDLASEDGIVRVTARRSLVAIGRPAVSALIKALGSKNQWMRWEVLKALGQIGDASATEALVRALEDKEFDVRWLAAEGLIRIGRKIILPLLRRLLDNPKSIWLREGTHHVLHDMDRGEWDEILRPTIKALESVEPSRDLSFVARKATDALIMKSS